MSLRSVFPLCITQTFCSQLIFLLLAGASAGGTFLQREASASQACEPDSKPRKAKVRSVTDGDSLVLSDGTRVRVIGINSPELYTSNGKQQPHAAAARAQALKLINQNKRSVTLYSGTEEADRHDRALFHVFLNNGRNLATELLQRGLAAQSAVAPNTLCANWYRDVEQIARRAKKGIWKKPELWFTDSAPLKRSASGFHIIRDRVVKIRHYKNSMRLFLENGVTVSSSLPRTLRVAALEGQTKSIKIEALQDHVVEVRGWLYKNRKKHAITLHHDANIQLTQ